MDAELKGKFDDLDDLLSGGYISKEEFAAARENLLVEAGFDVSPRTGGLFGGNLAFRPHEESGGGRSGCGCFLIFLLLAALLIGGFLALPEGVLKGIPIVGNLIEGQGIQEMRQSVIRFIDDLRGNPAPDTGPVSVTVSPEAEGPDDPAWPEGPAGSGGDEDKDTQNGDKEES